MANLNTKIIIVLLIVTTFFSCLKPETYPVEPKIDFVDFVASSDSGTLTFSFTDGDGNVGLDQDMLNYPFEPGNFYHHNIYINYYEISDGELVKGTSDPSGNNSPNYDTVFFPFRVENLTPSGQNKALKGTISVVLEPFYFNPNSVSSDSIKYEILLIDRSLNHSNLLLSPLIVR
tara:strand:+ start:1595 stop:2119 length:525 start_codon:yes stop_codon:yes gene_type:complete